MDRITLKNFRCFREEQAVRLAPLTLLVGENSTGKTSFLVLIRALWDAAGRGVPDFKKEPYDLGGFDDIAHHRGGRGGRADTFHAEFDYVHDGRSMRFRVVFGKRKAVPLPMKGRLSDRNDDVWIEHDRQVDDFWRILLGAAGGVWEVERRIPGDIDYETFPLHRLSEEDRTRLIALRGSAPPDSGDWERITRMSRLYPLSNHFDERLYAGAPVRSRPRRTYDPGRPSRNPEGDYIPMYLAGIHFESERKWQSLKDALEGFGQESGLFDEISVRPLGKKESDPFQLQVRIRESGSRRKGAPRNLIDVGYGVGQVLPIVTELRRDDAPAMFLLQQPEVHLHPSAQAALGSLFCRIAEPKRQLVIETHSDHLLDRVRMDIRDGRAPLKPADVSILYFERGDLDVRIHSLHLDEQGNVRDAPPSYRAFFMEETRRSLGL